MLLISLSQDQNSKPFQIDHRTQLAPSYLASAWACYMAHFMSNENNDDNDSGETTIQNVAEKPKVKNHTCF